jgi:hypothetical protein
MNDQQPLYVLGLRVGTLLTQQQKRLRLLMVLGTLCLLAGSWILASSWPLFLGGVLLIVIYLLGHLQRWVRRVRA